MLENLPSIDEEDVIDLTSEVDSTSGQPADTESGCMYSNLTIRTRKPVENLTDLLVLVSRESKGLAGAATESGSNESSPMTSDGGCSLGSEEQYV